MRVLQRNRPNRIDEDINVDTLLPRKRCIIRIMDTENSLHLNLLSANWTPGGGGADAVRPRTGSDGWSCWPSSRGDRFHFPLLCIQVNNMWVDANLRPSA